MDRGHRRSSSTCELNVSVSPRCTTANKLFLKNIVYFPLISSTKNAARANVYLFCDLLTLWCILLHSKTRDSTHQCYLFVFLMTTALFCFVLFCFLLIFILAAWFDRSYNEASRKKLSNDNTKNYIGFKWVFRLGIWTQNIHYGWVNVMLGAETWYPALKWASH